MASCSSKCAGIYGCSLPDPCEHCRNVRSRAVEKVGGKYFPAPGALALLAITENA